VKQALCSISSNVEVMPGVYLMWIDAPEIAATAKPGQFITVRCGDFILRRPFSIHQVGSSSVTTSEVEQSQVAILFKIAGKGTLWLSQQEAGQRIDILGPLGKGFAIAPESEKLLLVAGGIGLAPLVFLVQQALPEHQITLVHGAKTATQLFPDACQLPAMSHERVRFITVTEDGSAGQKGTATDVFSDYLAWAHQVYACGPVDMYKVMAQMSSPAKGSNLKLKRCQVSLEVRMGCGFGACYCCTINTKKGLRQVCRDGPVFQLDDIIWQEVRL
jgi:dihydroorotate dehydrogenase electron transfer subunit